MLSRRIYKTRYADPKGAILFLHGWKSNQEGYAPICYEMNERGYDCLTFDLRGHGRSDGTTLFTSRKEYMKDCVLAYDTLAKLTKAKDIYLVGVSYGGYLALCLLTQRNPAGVAVLVPANFTRETFDNPFSFIHECDQSVPVLGTQANEGLENFKGDIQIIEAGRDEIVHPNVLAGYLECAPPEKLQYITLLRQKHGLDMKGYLAYDWFMKGWLEGEREAGVFEA